MFRPMSLLASPIAPTLTSGFPSRWAAEASTTTPITVGYLPRAVVMLAVQNRAIDGKWTFTTLDWQPCRLLHSIPFDLLSRVLCLVPVVLRRCINLFAPSLQWVSWPPLAGALRFPTFVSNMGS